VARTPDALLPHVHCSRLGVGAGVGVKQGRSGGGGGEGRWGVVEPRVLFLGGWVLWGGVALVPAHAPGACVSVSSMIPQRLIFPGLHCVHVVCAVCVRVLCVRVADTERLIGDAAKNQVAMNPENTVFDAKRLIGRKITEAVVQADMKHWPFKVRCGVARCCWVPGVAVACLGPWNQDGSVVG
jgi:hypothetical protein